MKLNEQEIQLICQVLRVSNKAIGTHKIDLIRKYIKDTKAKEQANAAELNATFDFHEQVWQLLQKFEHHVATSGHKSLNKKPRRGKRERGT